MRFILLILLFFAFDAPHLQAQRKPVLVKLWDGNDYVGEKISERDSSFTLKLERGKTISIDKDNVWRYYDRENAIIYPDGRFFNKKGYIYWAISAGTNAMSLVQGFNQRWAAHLEFLFNARISNKVNLGAGAGWEANQAEIAGLTLNTQFQSIFIYGRYYLTDTKPRIFAFSRIGVANPAFQTERWFDFHSGGFNTINGFGVHFAAKKDARFQITIGHYMQKTDGQTWFNDAFGETVRTRFDIWIQRYILKFGWEFG